MSQILSTWTLLTQTYHRKPQLNGNIINNQIFKLINLNFLYWKEDKLQKHKNDGFASFLIIFLLFLVFVCSKFIFFQFLFGKISHTKHMKTKAFFFIIEPLRLNSISTKLIVFPIRYFLMATWMFVWIYWRFNQYFIRQVLK